MQARAAADPDGVIARSSDRSDVTGYFDPPVLLVVAVTRVCAAGYAELDRAISSAR
jgi:hypothetical protein